MRPRREDLVKKLDAMRPTVDTSFLCKICGGRMRPRAVSDSSFSEKNRADRHSFVNIRMHVLRHS